MSTTISFKAKTGDPFDEIIKEVNVSTQELKQQINELATETQVEMVHVITDNKVRPQNGEPLLLENHIHIYFFEDGWGLGDVDELNQFAPYWAAINWGSDHMVGKRVPDGYFAPGGAKPEVSSFRQGRWNVGELGDGGFGNGKTHWSFIVQTPIPPMNYIEKTTFWLDGKLQEIVLPQ